MAAPDHNPRPAATWLVPARLGAQLLLATAALAAILLASVAWWHASASLDRQQAHYGSTVAGQLAALAVEPLAANDRLRLDTLVDRFGNQPAIAAASIHGLDQRLLAEVGTPLSGVRSATAEVGFGGAVVGQVLVQVHPDALATELPPLAVVLALATLAALLLAAAASLLLTRHLGSARSDADAAAASASAATKVLERANLDDAPIRLGVILLGLSRWPAGLQARAVHALLEQVRPVVRRHGGRVASVSAGLLGQFPGSPDPAGGDDVADGEAMHQAILAALAMQQAMAGVIGELGLNADDIRLGLHSGDDGALLLAAMASPGTIAVHPELWHAELGDQLAWQERHSAALAALGAECCILVSGETPLAAGD